MSVETDTATIRRYYEEVLNGRDVDLLDRLAVADYREHDPLPGQGDDRDGLKQRVRMLIDAFDPQFTVEDLVAEPGKVVVRWTHAGRHVGAFMGIPATGRTFRIAGIDIHRLEDGRMAEHWHVIDQLAFLQQLGLVPAPEGAPA
ncbi:MAG TPA: ester cyclase [Candidatus Limnocylindrales bacterium]